MEALLSFKATMEEHMRRLAVLVSALVLGGLAHGASAQTYDHTWNPSAGNGGFQPGMPDVRPGSPGTSIPTTTTPTGGARWTWSAVGVTRCACTTGWLGNSTNYWTDWMQSQRCEGDGCTASVRWCYGNYEADPVPMSQRPAYNVGRVYGTEATSCPGESTSSSGFPFAFPKPSKTKSVGWDGIWRSPDGTVYAIQSNPAD